jgi:hypothetical protein
VALSGPVTGTEPAAPLGAPVQVREAVPLMLVPPVTVAEKEPPPGHSEWPIRSSLFFGALAKLGFATKPTSRSRF